MNDRLYKETKWLRFEVVVGECPAGCGHRRKHRNPKTIVMHVVSKSRAGLILGEISWFGRWRQYTFNPEPGTTFNSECLQDIEDVLISLNFEHKNANVKMAFKVGDTVNHELYGKGEVIEGDVPEGELLVHFFKRTLDCPDGFHKITSPFELEKPSKRK